MCRLIWVFTVRKWFKTHATLTIIDTYFIISLIKSFDLEFFKYCLMLFSRSNSIPTNIIRPLNVISRAVLQCISEFGIQNSGFGMQNEEFRIRNCEKVWKWNLSQLGHRAYIVCSIVQYGFAMHLLQILPDNNGIISCHLSTTLARILSGDAFRSNPLWR